MNAEQEINMCECDGLSLHLFRAVHAGIVIVDADTKEIIDINPHACYMIGITREKVVGKKCKDYLCVEDCDGCPVMTKNLIEGVEDVENKEVVIYRKDGTRVYALLTINSIILENKRLFINTLTDITKQREAENQLEEYWNKAGKMLSDNIHKLKNGSV
jgi:PAS domain S-box-containing protein